MPEFIDRHQVRRLLERGAQLVEVLPEEAFDEEHLPGAVNIHLKELPRRAPAELNRSQPVIVYCQDTL
jgi:rhodanese-related sulfurtransferase